MTRRSKRQLQHPRRRVILLAVVTLILLVSPLFALSTRWPSGSPAPVRVVVEPGDTLWSLAERYGPANEDTRRVVYDIRKTNCLTGSLITPGQVLLIEPE